MGDYDRDLKVSSQMRSLCEREKGVILGVFGEDGVGVGREIGDGYLYLGRIVFALGGECLKMYGEGGGFLCYLFCDF